MEDSQTPMSNRKEEAEISVPGELDMMSTLRGIVHANQMKNIK